MWKKLRKIRQVRRNIREQITKLLITQLKSKIMYNYFHEVKLDLLNAILDSSITIEADKKTSVEEISDQLNTLSWDNDSITGNASGSYTFNSLEAREFVLDNEDLVYEVASEFGIDMGQHCYDWEYLDVSIRCYVLAPICDEVASAIKDYLSEDKALDDYKSLKEHFQDWFDLN